MVDCYWRRIDDNINNLENAIQISSILLKLKEHETKLNDISKIESNETDIASNKTKIDTNETDISSNKIKIDNFTQYFLEEDKDFSESYNIEKKIFKFDENKSSYIIFEKTIKYNFSINSLLFIKNNIFYKYRNLLNDYYKLQHIFNIYDDENNIIQKFIFNNYDYYKNSNSIINTTEDFCMCFKKKYNEIKTLLLLQKINPKDIDNINLEIDDVVINNINISYKSRDNINDINKNEKNITSNLKEIGINKNEINNLKQNKTYLKNLYNILFYNSRTQVTFNILFYQNFFNLDANKNDFIEVSFRTHLETGDSSLSQYVIVNQEILDDNNISLFKKSTALNRFKHSSNKIIINASFVYHFKKDVKKLKFILYFRRTYNQYLDLHYIVNKDYKFILKHYSP